MYRPDADELAIPPTELDQEISREARRVSAVPTMMSVSDSAVMHARRLVHFPLNGYSRPQLAVTRFDPHPLADGSIARTGA